jgi:hypothetical protein
MIRAIAFDCFGVLLDDYGHNWVNQSELPEDVKAKLAQSVSQAGPRRDYR